MSRFDDRAWAEVEETAQWYEDRAPGYGDRLFDAAEVAVADVNRFPRAGALYRARGIAHEIRRAPLSGFPYSIYYTLEPEIVFLAFAHVARDQGYWLGRLDPT